MSENAFLKSIEDNFKKAASFLDLDEGLANKIMITKAREIKHLHFDE